jgi:hypothetical protein
LTKNIAQLQTDGRTTLEELAKSPIHKHGNQKRLERLIKKEIIKISALITPTPSNCTQQYNA